MSPAQHNAEVDEDRCVGTGDCARVAPHAFAVRPEGRARVLPTVGDADMDDLLDAAQNCPMQAIRVFDDQGRPMI